MILCLSLKRSAVHSTHKAHLYPDHARLTSSRRGVLMVVALENCPRPGCRLPSFGVAMQMSFIDPFSAAELHGGTSPLVGRQSELHLIDSLLDTVALNKPAGARALTISGETGAGKTRLLAEIQKEARRRGFRILEGSAYKSGCMFPYFPFIEALRPVLRSSSREQLDRYLGLDGGKQSVSTGDEADTISFTGIPMVAALARLFPELPKKLRVTVPLEVLSPEQEKFRLFDTIATLLEYIAIE